MGKKIKCWEFFECDEVECPVYKAKELNCWLVGGTHCRQEIQGQFLEKIEMCLVCEPFKTNVDLLSLEQTLKVVNEQFIEFRRMVDERDRELEGISMELAVGLSEVFEALRRISSGDPEVRIPATSKLELITKLKKVVNKTAEEIAEIIDLSHNFAIGLEISQKEGACVRHAGLCFHKPKLGISRIRVKLGNCNNEVQDSADINIRKDFVYAVSEAVHMSNQSICPCDLLSDALGERF
jgi:hypothetical protein